MDQKKPNQEAPVLQTTTDKENNQDLEMNRNTNERANENVKENSFEEDLSSNEVGSEITDGEAG